MKASKPYGEQNRIIVPHTFKHENGVAAVDRKIENLLKVCATKGVGEC